MPKKTTRQTKPSALAIGSDPMAEAERRIAEARRTNATDLDLGDLGLTEVPAALFELRRLQKLDRISIVCRENSTTGSTGHTGKTNLFPQFFPRDPGVPRGLFPYTHLQTDLNLNNNQLWEIPEMVGELQQLQTLNLGVNKLQRLPTRRLLNQKLG